MAGRADAALLVAVVSKSWHLVFLAGIWVLVAAIVVLAIMMPSRNQAACDRLFAEFMTTSDDVVVTTVGCSTRCFATSAVAIATCNRSWDERI